MNRSLQLDTLGIMHDEIRHKSQVVEMSWLVRDGLFWTRDVLHAHAHTHTTLWSLVLLLLPIFLTAG